MDFFEATMTIGAAEVLDDATAELLIRVENSGDVLYATLAERLGNDDAAKLLNLNGREEVGHANRIIEVMRIRHGESYQPPAECFEKFEVSLPDVIDPSMLPLIVEGEFAGDVGYQKWAEAETDPRIVELLVRNGREESKHAERMQRVIAILEAASA